MKIDEGWCLRTPAGVHIAETFRATKDEAWVESFSFLYYRKSWMKPFYKKWDESIKAAEDRGWRLVEVSLFPVETQKLHTESAKD